MTFALHTTIRQSKLKTNGVCRCCLLTVRITRRDNIIGSVLAHCICVCGQKESQHRFSHRWFVAHDASSSTGSSHEHHFHPPAIIMWCVSVDLKFCSSVGSELQKSFG